MIMAVDGTNEPGRAERRHDLPDAQGDAAGRRARRHPRRPAPAARRRHRRPLRPRPPQPHPPAPRLRARGLHLAPWLVLIAIVYFANLVGLLPHSPDAVIPPDSRLARHPALPARGRPASRSCCSPTPTPSAVERRLERRFATDARATIFVSHLLPRGHRAAAAARRPVRGAAGAAGRHPVAARAARRLGALDPAGLPRAAHGAGAAHLLRSAARTWAGRSGGTSSCCSRTARSRPRRSCSPPCSSPPPACSRTRCTSADGGRRDRFVAGRRR